MKNGMGKAVSGVNSLKSLMVLVRLPAITRTTRNSSMTAEMMAISEDGTTLKSFNGTCGKNSITDMLVKQMTNIQMSSAPSFHSCVSESLNGCSCANPITMASPLQNPIITGAGSIVMKRDNFSQDTSIMNTPANITDGNRSSTPSPLFPVPAVSMKVPMIAAKAPVAPLTIPGLPPNADTVKPMTQAACSAMGGLMWAMKAKATDSGICAKQTVTPKSTSRKRYSGVTP
mmetsp:Transcript_56523/g.132554  ORF Transcript_56523/g.132554 Transcript_56523/m.132554 type:complete len:230 (-) Transcript_56523:107-796(-)